MKTVLSRSALFAAMIPTAAWAHPGHSETSFDERTPAHPLTEY